MTETRTDLKGSRGVTVLPFEPLAKTPPLRRRAGASRAIRRDPQHAEGLSPLQPAHVDAVKMALGLEKKGRLVLLDAAGAAAEEQAWRVLATRALEPNVFFEPSFALAAAQHLAEAGQPRFAFIYDGDAASGRLIGIVPFTRSRLDLGLPVMRGWQHDYAALGAPLLDGQHAELALDVLFDHLDTTSSRRILFCDLRAEGPLFELLQQVSKRRRQNLACVAERRRAALLIGDHAEADRSSGPSAGRLKELRRQRRALERQAPLRFETVIEPRAVSPALEAFLVLEAAGWKGGCGTALVQDAGRATFVRSLVRDLSHDGRVRIDQLFCGETLVASAISLTGSGQAAFWKIAYDERFARFSPGVLLTQELTRAFSERADLDMVDSCAIEGHPMIERLWASRLRLVDCLISTEAEGATGYGVTLMRERVRRTVRARAKRIAAAVASRLRG